MSIFCSGGGPGNRVSITEGGHHRPSPQGGRRGCSMGCSRGARWVVLCDQGSLANGHFVKVKLIISHRYSDTPLGRWPGEFTPTSTSRSRCGCRCVSTSGSRCGCRCTSRIRSRCRLSTACSGIVFLWPRLCLGGGVVGVDHCTEPRPAPQHHSYLPAC